MKLEIRKLGPLRDRLEVVGDHAGLAELRDALTSALTGALVYGAADEYRIDRKPEGLGETITIRVVA